MLYYVTLPYSILYVILHYIIFDYIMLSSPDLRVGRGHDSGPGPGTRARFDYAILSILYYYYTILYYTILYYTILYYNLI